MWFARSIRLLWTLWHEVLQFPQTSLHLCVTESFLGKTWRTAWAYLVSEWVKSYEFYYSIWFHFRNHSSEALINSDRFSTCLALSIIKFLALALHHVANHFPFSQWGIGFFSLGINKDFCRDSWIGQIIWETGSTYSTHCIFCSTIMITIIKVTL